MATCEFTLAISGDVRQRKASMPSSIAATTTLAATTGHTTYLIPNLCNMASTRSLDSIESLRASVRIVAISSRSSW